MKIILRRWRERVKKYKNFIFCNSNIFITFFISEIRTCIIDCVDVWVVTFHNDAVANYIFIGVIENIYMFQVKAGCKGLSGHKRDLYICPSIVDKSLLPKFVCLWFSVLCDLFENIWETNDKHIKICDKHNNA